MTPAERKQRERDTRREAGLVRLEVWVYPAVRDKVRAYAERQNRAAERDEAKVAAVERMGRRR